MSQELPLKQWIGVFIIGPGQTLSALFSIRNRRFSASVVRNCIAAGTGCQQGLQCTAGMMAG
jgi:hypothetical protein